LRPNTDRRQVHHSSVCITAQGRPPQPPPPSPLLSVKRHVDQVKIDIPGNKPKSYLLASATTEDKRRHTVGNGAMQA